MEVDEEVTRCKGDGVGWRGRCRWRGRYRVEVIRCGHLVREHFVEHPGHHRMIQQHLRTQPKRWHAGRSDRVASSLWLCVEHRVIQQHL